ncbi:wax ester/triacylglycerol synthase domain-containing protein [Streptomyces thioluteus]
MSPLDAWLHSHQAGGALCMTFGLIARFGGEPPALDALRDRVAHRWARHERLRISSGTELRWIPGPPFDPAHHVSTPARQASLEEHTAHLIARPFGPPRPPWHLHVLPAPDGGFALLLRAHHALLDAGRSSRSSRICSTGRRPRCPRNGREARPRPAGGRVSGTSSPAAAPSPSTGRWTPGGPSPGAG